MSLSSGAVPRPGRAVLADVPPGERVRDLALVLGYAGVTGLAAQVAIPLPFTPVPVTGQTLVVLLGAGAQDRGLTPAAGPDRAQVEEKPPSTKTSCPVT